MTTHCSLVRGRTRRRVYALLVLASSWARPRGLERATRLPRFEALSQIANSRKQGRVC